MNCVIYTNSSDTLCWRWKRRSQQFLLLFMLSFHFAYVNDSFKYCLRQPMGNVLADRQIQYTFPAKWIGKSARTYIFFIFSIFMFILIDVFKKKKKKLKMHFINVTTGYRVMHIKWTLLFKEHLHNSYKTRITNSICLPFFTGLSDDLAWAMHQMENHCFSKGTSQPIWQ